LISEEQCEILVRKYNINPADKKNIQFY